MEMKITGNKTTVTTDNLVTKEIRVTMVTDPVLTAMPLTMVTI